MRLRPGLQAFLLTLSLLSTANGCTCDGPPLRATEAVLRNDLATLRDVLRQSCGDRGECPRSLDELVLQGYLRKIPIDPVTRRRDSWVIKLRNTPSGPRIAEIHSGAPGTGRDGTPFAAW